MTIKERARRMRNLLKAEGEYDPRKNENAEELIEAGVDGLWLGGLSALTGVVIGELITWPFEKRYIQHVYDWGFKDGQVKAYKNSVKAFGRNNTKEVTLS